MRKIFLSTMTTMLILFISIPSMGQQKTPDTETNSLTQLASDLRTRPLTDLSDSELQLLVYEREILRGFLNGDLEETMDLFMSKDAMVFPPDIEFITGLEKQKELFKAWLGMEGVLLDWEPIDAFVDQSDDMGYVYGLVRWKNPNEPQRLGKYISIWVKQDGKWMNKVEIRNSTMIEE